MDNILIISIKKLKPVRSGFQNTVFLLYLSLKSKFKVHFLKIDNSNDIDPVFNLKYDEVFSKKIKIYIKKKSPKYIFVNTTKLLKIYEDIFFNSKTPIVLVCHDLYHFRKKYFENNKFRDESVMTDNQEINLLSCCTYIIDFANYEKEYLVNNGIKKEKLVYTPTPVRIHKFLYSSSREFNYFFIGSNWKQNSISIEAFFKNYQTFFLNKKVKIVGSKLNSNFPKFSFSPSLQKKHFLNAQIGLAPIFEGTGRNVKIFSMMSYGLPVITNKNLSEYGLEDKIHYVKVDLIEEWGKKLLDLESNYPLRRKIALNGWSWVNQNCNYKIAFNKFIDNL